jgi:hypothetical protein
MKSCATLICACLLLTTCSTDGSQGDIGPTTQTSSESGPIASQAVSSTTTVEVTMPESTRPEPVSTNTPTVHRVDLFLQHLAAGDFVSAATESAYSVEQLVTAWGVEPRDRFLGMTTVQVLRYFCEFGGGLCVEPLEVSVTGDDTIVAHFADGAVTTGESIASFEVSDAGVAGLNPVSQDGRGSRCAVLRLSPGHPHTRPDPVAPSSGSAAWGLVWPGIDDAAFDVYLTWTPSGTELWTRSESVESVDMAGTPTDVYSIDESGFAAVAELPIGCGAYNVWTFASASDPSHLRSVIENLELTR